MAPVESFGAALCILAAALTPLAVFYTKLTCTLITSILSGPSTAAQKNASNILE